MCASARLLQPTSALGPEFAPPRPLQALRVKSEQLAQLLLQRYRLSIDRDPTLWGPIMKARAAHVPAPAAGMGGLFGDLFKMLAPPPQAAA